MSPLDEARVACGRLRRWLAEAATPLWSGAGVDPSGAFEEKLDQDGRPVASLRRARVQPRQLYALVGAERLGATVDLRTVRRGLAAFLTRYVKPNGLIRSAVDGDGRVLDDGAVLYDQAFALFALADMDVVLGPAAEVSAEALRRAVLTAFRHPVAGFHSAFPPTGVLLSNPHMHLFEAALAWIEADGDSEWRDLANEIKSLALEVFINDQGALLETFDDGWRPAPGLAGRIVEPGHQFEWAWLLLRWSGLTDDPADAQACRHAALRLIEIGERFGVDRKRGVAIDALLDDFSVHDAQARLWPQTERIKAHALAAIETGKAEHWTLAAAAVVGLETYLATPTPGLWFDRLTPDGRMVDEAAPASSFYHIVCAIEALSTALARADTRLRVAS